MKKPITATTSKTPAAPIISTVSILLIVSIVSTLIAGCSKDVILVGPQKSHSKEPPTTDNKGNDSTTPTPQEQQTCESDSDCVPIPSCHPRACIHKNYQDRYKKPDMCTELFDCSAAYSAEDCLCVDGTCRNQNLGNKGCPDAMS